MSMHYEGNWDFFEGTLDFKSNMSEDFVPLKRRGFYMRRDCIFCFSTLKHSKSSGLSSVNMWFQAQQYKIVAVCQKGGWELNVS